MPDLNSTPFGTKHLEAEEDHIEVFNGKGTLTFVSFFNGSAVTLYLMRYDSDAAPSGAATFAPVVVPAGSYYESNAHLGFSTGCRIGVSTTKDTYSGADEVDDCQLDVGFAR